MFPRATSTTSPFFVDRKRCGKVTALLHRGSSPAMLSQKAWSILVLLSVVASLGDAALFKYVFNKTFADAKSAHCLDGSPAGFYWSKGNQTKKWTIHLEGGGLCDTAESCQQRSKTPLGSSSYWPASFNGLAIFSSDMIINPDFYDWNHVFLPYCSGDVWTGTVQKPTNATFNFYFSGHLNFAAVLDFLSEYAGLGSATDIILSGASAGGIGTFNNIDFLAQKMKGVRVVGNPWGGWYFPNAVTYPQWQQGLPGNFSSKPFYTLYRSYLNQDCVAQHSSQPWYCGPLSVPEMYPYIKTPVYVAENMFDSNQIYAAGKCPKENTTSTNRYMLYYGQRMRMSIKEVLDSSRDGLYMPSCLSHVCTPYEFASSPKIDGTTFAQSLGDWYFHRGKVPTKLLDSCYYVQCNKECPKTPC